LNNKEWVNEFAEDNDINLIVLDGLDDAIVGVAHIHTLPLRVVYSYSQIIEILTKDGMSEEEAQEYFDFNIAVLWVGADTPAILYTP